MSFIRFIAVFALAATLTLPAVEAIQGHAALDLKGRQGTHTVPAKKEGTSTVPVQKEGTPATVPQQQESPTLPSDIKAAVDNQDRGMKQAQAERTEGTAAAKAPPMGIGGVFGCAFGGTIIFGLLVMGLIVCRRPGKDDHESHLLMHHGGQHFGGDKGKGKGKGKDHGMHAENEHHGMHPGKGESKGKGKGKGEGHGMHAKGEHHGMQPEKGMPHAGKQGFGGKKGKPGVGPAMGGKQGHQSMPIAQVAAPVAQVATPVAAASAAAPAVAVAASTTAKAQAAVAELPSGAPRAPELNTKMALIVEVKNGIDMPSVNTFGGCDPFIEIRIVKGDPSKNGGDLEAIPKDTVKTKSIDGDTTPDWNETLRLAKATYADDTFVNILLWDSNLTKNTPIGYQHVRITELLSGMTYDASVTEPTKKEFVAASFQSLLADKSMALKASVNMSFSYIEVHKFTFNIKSGSNLPVVDTLGSIDAYVEVRLVKGDPKTLNFERSPGPETLWSAKTNAVNDSTAPTWNQNLSVTAPAEPGTFFVFAVIDAGNMVNTPVGMVVVPLQGLCGQRNGEVEYNSNLQKLPNWDAPEGLTKAKLKFKLSHYIATGA